MKQAGPLLPPGPDGLPNMFIGNSALRPFLTITYRT